MANTAPATGEGVSPPSPASIPTSHSRNRATRGEDKLNREALRSESPLMTTAEMGLSAVIALMGGGNIFNWLSSRGKTKVDLIALAQSIAAETIKALDTRIAHLEATIEDQGRKIDDLTAHIGKLEDVILGLGGTPPPRPRKRVEP